MSDKSRPALNRRVALAGAGTAGALAAAAALLPGAKPDPTLADAAGAAKKDAQGGYQLTEHVKRYYATTRV